VRSDAEHDRKLCIARDSAIRRGLGFAMRFDCTAISATKALWDTYCFPGLRPEPTVRDDPKARVITLNRRSKKPRAAVAVMSRWAGTTKVRRVRDLGADLRTRIVPEFTLRFCSPRRRGRLGRSSFLGRVLRLGVAITGLVDVLGRFGGIGCGRGCLRHDRGADVGHCAIPRPFLALQRAYPSPN
jgi:hypothetical protein